LPAEKRLHTRRALIDVNVERLLAVPLGENQLVNVHSISASSQETAKKYQQQREARKALLPIDDILASVFAADDDRPEEVALSR